MPFSIAMIVTNSEFGNDAVGEKTRRLGKAIKRLTSLSPILFATNFDDLLLGEVL